MKKRKIKNDYYTWYLAIGLSCLVLVLYFFFVFTEIKNNKNSIESYDKVKLIDAIDGDTIRLYNNEVVRLIGINSPEKNEKCFNEAKEKILEILYDREISLEMDITDKDKYQRSLRYVYIKLDNEEDIKSYINSDKIVIEDLKKEGIIKYNFDNEILINVNILMVKEGYARRYSYGDDRRYEQEIIQAEGYARSNRLGCLWK
jgi:micrococcal nuclease